MEIGKVVIHALDEKVRAYYNLEKLWSTYASNQDHGVGQGQVYHFVVPCQLLITFGWITWSVHNKCSNIFYAKDLDKAFVKVRPKNNSKKRPLQLPDVWASAWKISFVMLAGNPSLYIEVVSSRNPEFYFWRLLLVQSLNVPFSSMRCTFSLVQSLNVPFSSMRCTFSYYVTSNSETFDV